MRVTRRVVGRLDADSSQRNGGEGFQAAVIATYGIDLVDVGIMKL